MAGYAAASRTEPPQLSPTGCPEALAAETPEPQPSALLRRRSRRPQPHATSCYTPLLRAAGRHGRQGRLYFLFVPSSGVSSARRQGPLSARKFAAELYKLLYTERPEYLKVQRRWGKG